MTIYDPESAGEHPASIRRRVAEAFASRWQRRGARRGGAISDHLLRDIGLTPFGVREAALAARNEARR